MYTVTDILNNLSNEIITKDEAFNQLLTLHIGNTPANMMVTNPQSFLKAEKNVDSMPQNSLQEADDEDDDEFNSELASYSHTVKKGYKDKELEKDAMSKLVDEYFKSQQVKRLGTLSESSLLNFLKAAKNLYTGN